MNRVQSDSYWYDAGYRTAKTETINRVLKMIDKDIDFYTKLGKPDNQNRDVINAFTDFRRSVAELKGGEQE